MACTSNVNVIPQNLRRTRDLHDCPCIGTPMGLHFNNATYSSKIATPPATGSIELDWTNAVDDCAPALLKVKTSGCYCIEDVYIEICLPAIDIGTADSPYADMGAYLVAVLSQHWSVSSFMSFEAVGAATAKKAKINWQSTTEGLYPHVEYVPQGYKNASDNGIVGATTQTDAQKVMCAKFSCGEPVGVNECETTVQSYTDTNADTLRFVGFVQADLCGGCACDCSPTCTCPPVRVFTSGETPLEFDPKVAIAPDAHILVWDYDKRVYGLLNDAEAEAALPPTVILHRNAAITKCCTTRPNQKVVRI
jgi:hypothetical protein